MLTAAAGSGGGVICVAAMISEVDDVSHGAAPRSRAATTWLGPRIVRWSARRGLESPSAPRGLAHIGKQTHDVQWASVDQHKVRSYATNRTGSGLLPIPDLVDRKAKLIREILLREPKLLPDRLHVDISRNVDTRRLLLTTCNRKRH